ncbi:hypothetical protein Sbal625DRAFT_0026 [Shewanella baltica OS625]|uniref:hypothetical protein n=1 Tax=Shewanella baltica TaxID=62322 RepID=UPI000230D5A9|nr:hypothetical protein [Shewanella baltica]EHC07695.1 hypothetical protein Sbal625DRAFT_0026 [Shewanella baltica OS625]
MDFLLKLFQIAFYITASVIAVLTFVKAKNGLLNSVNTEYQKKVMERLSELAEEIWEEFDFSSEKHWSKNKTLDEVMDKIHNFAAKNKHEILTGKSGFSGVPLPQKQLEMMGSLERIKSDPFIPLKIRDKLVSILDRRISSTFEAYHTVIKNYQDDLCKGKGWESFDHNKSIISNEVLSVMIKNGVGIAELQEAAHEVRLEIQKYYESFNPIKC